MNFKNLSKKSYHTDHSACLTKYMCYRNSHSADKGTTFFRHVQTNLPKLYPLHSKEINLCFCFKANFSTREINMLTRQSLQTIYPRKTQIRQKLSIPEADDTLNYIS